MNNQHRGTLLGITAYLIWGFAPLYWVQTEPVDPRDLVAHRVLWSLPFDTMQFLAFGLVWVGLAVVTVSNLRRAVSHFDRGC